MKVQLFNSIKDTNRTFKEGRGSQTRGGLIRIFPIDIDLFTPSYHSRYRLHITWLCWTLTFTWGKTIPLPDVNYKFKTSEELSEAIQ